jgi:hypothetical protein
LDGCAAGGAHGVGFLRRPFDDAKVAITDAAVAVKNFLDTDAVNGL